MGHVAERYGQVALFAPEGRTNTFSIITFRIFIDAICYRSKREPSVVPINFIKYNVQQTQMVLPVPEKGYQYQSNLIKACNIGRSHFYRFISVLALITVPGAVLEWTKLSVSSEEFSEMTLKTRPMETFRGFDLTLRETLFG